MAFVRFCWGKKRKALIYVNPCNAHTGTKMKHCWIYRGRRICTIKMGWIECTHSRGGVCIKDRHAQTHAYIVSKYNICANEGPFWQMAIYKNRTSRVPNVNKKIDLFTKNAWYIWQLMYSRTKAFQANNTNNAFRRCAPDKDMTKWEAKKTKQLYSRNGNGICAIPAKWKLRIISVFFCDLCMFLI